MLQQTPAAILGLREFMALSAAAAAEQFRSATEGLRMAKVVWSQLPQRVTLLAREGETVERPTTREVDAALDDYEAQAEFLLPLSYREFVHWFGPGLFTGSWFQLMAPIPKAFQGRVADVYDLEKQREMIQDPEGYWATSCDPEKLKRLVLFAST